MGRWYKVVNCEESVIFPCQIEFLFQEQLENSSLNLARILEQFKSNCT